MTIEPQDYAERAAEEIRGLNHAFGRADLGTGAALPFPPQAYDTVGSLADLAGRLPQALEGVSDCLTGYRQDAHVTADTGTPAEHIDNALQALHDAAQTADRLTHSLARAHSALSALGYRTEGP